MRQRTFRRDDFPRDRDEREGQEESEERERTIGEVMCPLFPQFGRQREQHAMKPELDIVIDQWACRAAIDSLDHTPQY